MNKFIVVFFILMFTVTNVFAEEQDKKFAHGEIVFAKQNLTMEVEIAKTRMQRAIGLMYRESLAKDKGMLFIFEKDEIQKVWMKETLISLDIVFISAQGKIVSIIKGLQPCRIESCDIYASTKSAKYMLEVNAGVIASKGISVGQMVLF